MYFAFLKILKLFGVNFSEENDAGWYYFFLSAYIAASLVGLMFVILGCQAIDCSSIIF